MDHSGPPGVGKTLTAETLAETFKAPLYTVRDKLDDLLSIVTNRPGCRGSNWR